MSNNNNYEILESNNDFVFNVTINSVPNDGRALRIDWTKNGLLLQNHRNGRISMSRVGSDFAYLMINGTECEDSGLYRVEANLLDRVFANLSLNLTINGCGTDFFSRGIEFQFEITVLIKQSIISFLY